MNLPTGGTIILVQHGEDIIATVVGDVGGVLIVDTDADFYNHDGSHRETRRVRRMYPWATIDYVEFPKETT